MQPGYYPAISNNVYHHGEGVSKSQLDLIDKSPVLFQWNQHASEDQEKNRH